MVGTYKSRHDMAQSLTAESSVDVVKCDVASAKDRVTLLDHVASRYGAVDLLVNNAGMAPRERRDILEAEEDSFDELIATNLKGPHFLTQQVARGMNRVRNRAHRLHHVYLRLHGICSAGRVLHIQSRAEHVRGALRAASRRT